MSLNRCQRCGEARPTWTTMSRFNSQIICPACECAERAHPKYAAAVAAELTACLRGDFNFAGLGLPPDLVR